ncbi:G-protein coupled receptor 176-like [Gigantopelta aegis]|uniref:G-protein coupled receptor 176-like n=1 Tax=Gigantopelta aegis TaxID=1735272 RepID=UPI001B88DADF|nr:G-protein coupled receptor 176-like [Gigantopelta aegis]
MSLIIQMNQQKALFLLPVTLLIAAITLFGFIGNAFVFYIYRTKFKKSTGNFFIVALSILDILSCVIACPFEIFDMSQPYFTGNIVCCKVFRFIELILNCAAGVMLVPIAIDRHAKVYNPLEYQTIGQARNKIIVTIALSVSCAWPQLALSGTRIVQTGLECVVGEDCSIASEFEGSVYTLLAYFWQYFVFLASLLCIVITYAHIVFIIANRRKTVTGKRKKVVTPQKSVVPDPEFKIHVSAGSKKIRANKTTVLMIAVTTSTILSYVPYLSVEVMKHNSIIFKPGMSAALDILSEFCFKSYFLSRVINPIIYFAIDYNFRRECFALVKWSAK